MLLPCQNIGGDDYIGHPPDISPQGYLEKMLKKVVYDVRFFGVKLRSILLLILQSEFFSWPGVHGPIKGL